MRKRYIFKFKKETMKNKVINFFAVNVGFRCTLVLINMYSTYKLFYKSIINRAFSCSIPCFRCSTVSVLKKNNINYLKFLTTLRNMQSEIYVICIYLFFLIQFFIYYTNVQSLYFYHRIIYFIIKFCNTLWFSSCF